MGQVKPGDHIRFVRMDYEQAVALEAAQDHSLRELSAAAPAMPAAASIGAPARATASETIIAALPAEGTRPSVAYRQAGDGYLLLEYGDNVLDLALRMRIHLLMEALRERPVAGVRELSPGVRSLQIRYDSRLIRQDALIARLLEIEAGLADVATLKVPTRVVHLPLAFEDSATLGAVRRYQETVRASAPWLPNNVDFIQRINGLASRDEVRRIVYDASYLVMGLGDVYLGAPCAVPIDPRHRLLTSKYNPARTYGRRHRRHRRRVHVHLRHGLAGRLPAGGAQPADLEHVHEESGVPGRQALAVALLRPGALLSRQRGRAGRLARRLPPRPGQRPHRGGSVRLRRASALPGRAGDQHRRLPDAPEKRLRRGSRAVAERGCGAAAGRAGSRPEAQAELREGERLVSADMCGNVWKVPVEVGQSVSAGDTLVVVEAMKMELSVIAPAAGVVTAIRCVPGKPVNAGDPLVVLAEDAPCTVA